MFNSKRFIAFVIAVILFVLLLLITKYSPMELAGAISLISGIYIGADTLRKTDTTNTYFKNKID